MRSASTHALPRRKPLLLGVVLALALAVAGPASAEDQLPLTPGTDALALAAAISSQTSRIASEVQAQVEQYHDPDPQYQAGNAPAAPDAPSSANAALETARLALSEARTLSLSSSVSVSVSTPQGSTIVQTQVHTDERNAVSSDKADISIRSDVRSDNTSSETVSETSSTIVQETVPVQPAIVPDRKPEARHAEPQTRTPKERPAPSEPTRPRPRRLVQPTTQPPVPPKAVRSEPRPLPFSQPQAEPSKAVPQPRPVLAERPALIRARPSARDARPATKKSGTKPRLAASAQPYPRAEHFPGREERLAGSASSAGSSGASPSAKNLAVLLGALALVALGSVRRARWQAPAPRPLARGRPLDRPG